MNTTTKIDLPLFTGFYESIHSFDFEYIIEDLLQGLENGENYYNINESDIKRIKESKYKYCEASEVFYDYCDINNTEYKRGYSKEYTSNFKDIFSEILKEL